MIALLRRVPAWVWLVVVFLAFAAVEDVRHQACENRGGHVIPRVVIDGCAERSPK